MVLDLLLIGLAFILGWLACLIVVIVAVFVLTGNRPPRPQTAPSTAVLAVKLALVGFCLLLGLWLVGKSMYLLVT